MFFTFKNYKGKEFILIFYFILYLIYSHDFPEYIMIINQQKYKYISNNKKNFFIFVIFYLYVKIFCIYLINISQLSIYN
jgi:hypothetical protein